MTLEQFQKLDDGDRWELIWNCPLLADRLESPYRYVIYQIESFYVELRYHIENNMFLDMWAFQGTEGLIPYIEQIKFHQKFGKPIATIQDLRDQVLKLLPSKTIQQILDTNKDDLTPLNFELADQILNNLGLWHTRVYDNGILKEHPYDVTFTIIHEIWQLDK